MIVVAFLFGFADLLPFNLLDYDLKTAQNKPEKYSRTTSS